jgi:hypothetical protein
MTRGPKPVLAIQEAREIAGERGEMLITSHYNFIIFCLGCTIFVRIRRVHSHISTPQDIMTMFRNDILQLRILPKTPVTSRELWVLSPWGTWQYFRVDDEQLIEIRRDGRPVPDRAGVAIKMKTPVVKDKNALPAHEPERVNPENVVREG